MSRVKRIWYLSPMRAAKVQASLRIRAVSPEPPLLAHTSSESRGTFRQKARSLAPLNGWACAVKICHDGMLEDTNSLDGARIYSCLYVHSLHRSLKQNKTINALQSNLDCNSVRLLESRIFGFRLVGNVSGLSYRGREALFFSFYSFFFILSANEKGNVATR